MRGLRPRAGWHSPRPWFPPPLAPVLLPHQLGPQSEPLQLPRPSAQNALPLGSPHPNHPSASSREVSPMGLPSPAPSPGLCPSQTGKASALLGGTGLGSNETINHIIMTLTSPARQAKGSVRTGRALIYSGCVLGPLRGAHRWNSGKTR